MTSFIESAIIPKECGSEGWRCAVCGVMVAALLCVATPASAQVPAFGSCVTNADSAGAVRGTFEVLVNKEDSLTVVGYNLPYRPAGGVTVISDDSVCAAGVRAYNNFFTGTSDTTARAVVIMVGTDRYVFWPVIPRTGTGRDLVFVFDTSWQLLKSIL